MRSLTLVLFLVVVGSGCQQAQSSSSAPTSSGTAAVAAAPKVAKVVFVDKENACDCTKKRIEGAWTALQAALGTPATLPVERIHIDTEAAKAETYTVLKPLMVAPGIYFVDGHDAVIEMLQGEVTREQVAAVLKGK